MNKTKDEMLPTRVAVIGLGSSGVVAVKNLIEEGFAVTGFEKRPYYGGIWHFTDDVDTLSALESTQTNIPIARMCYTDFPFPDGAPTYCSAKDVQTYIEAYVEHFQLLPHFRLSTDVRHVGEVAETGQWRIDLEDAPSEYFDKVVIATGPLSKPSPFRLQGRDRFAGTVIHSQHFKRPSDYAGKNVVVVGIGSTGADIANALVGVASKVYISHSKGAHILPREFNGVPLASILTHSFIRLNSVVDRFFPRLREFINGVMLRRIAHATFGKPDPAWKLDDAPPPTAAGIVVSDELIPNLRARLVHSIPSIDHVTDKTTVLLHDGTTVDADAIIFCTGYSGELCGGPVPGGQEALLDARVDPTRHADAAWQAAAGSRGRPLPRLYQNVFSLDRPSTLALVGFAWLGTTGAGALETADVASMCVAQAWRGRSPLPPPAAMERWMDGQARGLAGRARRTTVVPGALVDVRAWLVWADETAGAGIEQRVGAWATWSAWRFWWADRRLYGLVERGVPTAAVWRLFPGPKRRAWEGARGEVERLNAVHRADLAAYKAKKD